MKIQLLFLFFIFCQFANAQSAMDFEQIVNDLASMPDEDRDYGDVFDALYQVYAHPIDLNKAEIDELRVLYFLSEEQILGIIDHRVKHGIFLSIFELQTIPSIDATTARRVLPFVTIQKGKPVASGKKLWGRLAESNTHFLLLRQERVLQNQAGFIADSDTLYPDFQGVRNRTYLRYRLSSSKDYSFGITAEQDAGEPWGKKINKSFGADFSSFHAAFYNRGKIKQLLIGDFQLQIGQGLLSAGGFAMGKGAETVMGIRRNTKLLLPYTSVMESGFFRGIGATVELGKYLKITSFLSRRKLDATLENGYLGDTAQLFAASIQETGLHRTDTELARRKQLGETSTGFSLRFQKTRWEMGWTSIFTKFDFPFYRQFSDYNQFAFRGNENLVHGLDFRTWLGNTSFFGELGRSKSGGMGGIGGLVTSLSPQVDASLLIRHYDRDFHTLYGDPIGETSGGNNEQGIYTGLKIRPVKQWEIAAYTDVFRFPWLRFQSYTPSSGAEWLLRFQYKPSKKMLTYCQVRSEQRVRNLSAETLDISGVKEAVMVPMKRWNSQLNIDYQVDTRWSMQSRVQFNAYGQVGDKLTQGVALMQDITGDFGQIRISSRFAIFDTDWDTRVYAYEKDVLYAFSFPPYYGKGFRQVYVIKWDAMKNLDLWLRYAKTNYVDREQVGTGQQAIKGNSRSEVKFQMMYKF